TKGNAMVSSSSNQPLIGGTVTVTEGTKLLLMGTTEGIQYAPGSEVRATKLVGVVSGDCTFNSDSVEGAYLAGDGTIKLEKTDGTYHLTLTDAEVDGTLTLPQSTTLTLVGRSYVESRNASAIAVTGDLTIDSSAGGALEAYGDGNAITATEGNITIQGNAVVETGPAIQANGDGKGNITICDQAEVRVSSEAEDIITASGKLTVTGGKVTADTVTAGTLAISGGSVTADGIYDFTTAAISDNAVVQVGVLRHNTSFENTVGKETAESKISVSDNARLDVGGIAYANHFEQTGSAMVNGIVGEVAAGRWVYTVYGNVVLEQDYAAEGGSFTAPAATSLIVPNGVELDLESCKQITNGGTMIIDGTLVLPDIYAPQINDLNLTGSGMVKVDEALYLTDGNQLISTTKVPEFGENDDQLASHGYKWDQDTRTLTLKNMYLENSITLPKTGDITLVLEGTSVVIGTDGGIVQQSPEGSEAATGEAQPPVSKLTIKGDGRLKVGSNDAYKCGIQVAGALVMESGTILNATMRGAGIYANSIEIQNGTIDLGDANTMGAANAMTISGGSVTVGYNEGASLGAKTMEISGGVIKTGMGAVGSIVSNGGNVTITGGTVITDWRNIEVEGLSLGICAWGGNVTITGGSVTAKGFTAGIVAIDGIGADGEPVSNPGGVITTTGMTAVTTPAGGTVKSAMWEMGGTPVKVSSYTADSELELWPVEPFPENACTTVVLTKTANGGNSGSSGGSNTTTDKVTNPDGSTTTTVTDKITGTVTETTQKPDGSSVVTETKKDGSVTTTDKAANGVNTITKTDKDGNTTASVNVPSTIKDDVPVNLPADLGKIDGTVSVTITYPDGKKETVTGKYENGKVNVAVSGSATIEILDDFVPLAAMPAFTDVAEGAWYYGAVKYACEHGLFAGTSADTFSPNAPMTREMLWTVLGRLDGQTLAGAGVFDAAKAWAMEKGITDGSTPNGNITREQLVTILWRYAGSPMLMDYPGLSSFDDAGDITSYARQAMAWAHQQGLIEGSDGKLMPQGNATRAQVAAILMRYCENVAK
ncbi:MAG: S-layer homology domain-containing protein, partial [Oscillospiraceae bacterium]|nr:S-layer homology domain-containing protein [Oscillospiraceae bacterium]